MQVEIALWSCSFAVIVAACCWRAVAQLARGRRCTEAVRGTYAGRQGGTWIHGDAADESKIFRPVYRYEFAGVSYESAAGAAALLFDLSPAAKEEGKAAELRVNPNDPTEVYDAAYELWFAKYRIAWSLAACIGCFALVSLL